MEKWCQPNGIAMRVDNRRVLTILSKRPPARWKSVNLWGFVGVIALLAPGVMAGGTMMGTRSQEQRWKIIVVALGVWGNVAQDCRQANVLGRNWLLKAGWVRMAVKEFAAVCVCVGDMEGFWSGLWVSGFVWVMARWFDWGIRMIEADEGLAIEWRCLIFAQDWLWATIADNSEWIFGFSFFDWYFFFSCCSLRRIVFRSHNNLLPWHPLWQKM